MSGQSSEAGSARVSRPASPPTIAELCARYANENAHTEQVARLALALFDTTREWLGLAVGDRPVLAAAARLHDLGFGVEPQHHPHVSADIVAREGLRGFRAAQLREITTIIPLHAGEFGDSLPTSRLARLAAILRVADGLDHGHVQDANILRVNRRGDTVRLVVRSEWHPYNLTRAGIKADLWRAVCPLGIEFVQAPRAAAHHRPLLTPGLPPLEAARRLLSLPFKTMTINVPGLLAARASEPLHDFRVALRRLRALLRVFEQQLPSSAANNLGRELGQFSRTLSRARDDDVWLDFLQGRAACAALGTGPAAARFLHYQHDQRRLNQATVQRQVRSRRFAAVKQCIARLLRTDLPRLASTAPPTPPLPELAARHYQRAVKKIAKQAHLRHSQSPKKLHKLRVAMRKARYLGEFFGEILSAEVRRPTPRSKKAEQTLGRIHDLDVSLARLRVEGPPPPRALIHLLQRQCQEAQQTLGRAWKRLKLR